MPATWPLRVGTLLLVVGLTACGGGTETTTAADASTPSEAGGAATVPPTASAPAADPASQAEAPTAVAPAAGTAVAAAPAAAAGEETYKKTCAMCHGTPAMGAPVVGTKADWSERVAQGKDTLYKHALEGFTGAKGMMPARGGNPSLDDATVKAAVDHMVSSSQ